MELKKLRKAELVTLAENLQKELKSKENTLSQLKAGKAELKNEVSFLISEKTKFDSLMNNMIKPFIVDTHDALTYIANATKSVEVSKPKFFGLFGKTKEVKLVPTHELYEIADCTAKLVDSIYELLSISKEQVREATE